MTTERQGKLDLKISLVLKCELLRIKKKKEEKNELKKTKQMKENGKIEYFKRS